MTVQEQPPFYEVLSCLGHLGFVADVRDNRLSFGSHVPLADLEWGLELMRDAQQHTATG